MQRLVKAKSTKTLLTKILKKLFKDPIVVAVEGDWKTGKTDFSLYLSELLLKNKVIDEVASNVDTSGTYTYISDLQNLKFWLRRNKKTKLYIFDELNENAPSRRAMSNKSVGIISILPECSKAHARVIVLAQDFEGVDSQFRNSVWVKAYFRKIITKDSRVKTVRLRSTLLNWEYTFYGIPKTTIPFDPYLPAPFTLKSTENRLILDENVAKLAKWAGGVPWKELFKHPQECNRFVRKEVSNLLNLYSLFTSNSASGISEEKRELEE